MILVRTYIHMQVIGVSNDNQCPCCIVLGTLSEFLRARLH